MFDSADVSFALQMCRRQLKLVLYCKFTVCTHTVLISYTHTIYSYYIPHITLLSSYTEQ